MRAGILKFLEIVMTYKVSGVVRNKCGINSKKLYGSNTIWKLKQFEILRQKFAVGGEYDKNLTNYCQRYQPWALWHRDETQFLYELNEYKQISKIRTEVNRDLILT